MKILIISQYFDPENFRINEVTYELAKRNHDVSVLTGIPNYPEGKVYEGYEISYKDVEMKNGVKIYRTKIRPRKKGSINLFLNYLSFVLKSNKKIKLFDDFDIIYVYGMSPITQVIPGIKLKKKIKIPLVVNIQDLWPESILITSIKEDSLIFKLTKRVSLWIYKNINLILIPSLGFKKYLKEVGKVKEEKIKLLYNHAESFYLEFEDTKIDDKTHFLFAGNIGKAQNIEIMIEAMTSLDKTLLDKIVFDIVGDGSNLEELKRLVKDNKLEKHVMFHGRKELKDLKYFYELADICVLTLIDNSSISNTIPAKVQGYMASGNPILAIVSNGSSSKLIEEAKCGVIVDTNNIKDIALKIEYMINNIEQCYKMGQNGRGYFINNFTLNKHVDSLETYFREEIENVQR